MNNNFSESKQERLKCLDVCKGIGYFDNCFFYCTTPFQLLGAISIVVNERLHNSDLYIANTFKDYEAVACEIEKLNIFRNVVTLNLIELKIEADLTSNKHLFFKKALMFLRYIKCMLSLDKTVSKFIVPNVTYDRIYDSCNHYPARFLILLYKKNKMPVEVYNFDDGLGSYYSLSNIDCIPLYDKIFRILLYGKESVDIPFIKKIFSPDYYSSIFKFSNSKFLSNMKSIEKIEPLHKCETNDLIIQKVFGLSDEQIISQHFIFFDTIKAELYSNSGVKYANELQLIILKHIDINNIIFKFHPRDKEYDASLPHFENTSIPFELYCYYNDLSDKVLISDYSTAIFTPKILFDQEPIIILLFKIMSKYKLHSMDTSPINVLKDIYRDKSKIFIPENVEELVEFLAHI